MSSTHEPSSSGQTSNAPGSEHVQPGLAPAGQTPSAIQTPPAPPVKSATVRPPKKAPVRRRAMSPGELAVTITVMDGIAVVCLLIVAVFLGSFAIRNSDFWSYLAAGRLIAQGGYKFGVDPFAYTTQGTYWANHSWLFDLLLYTGFKTLGGPALVIIKAALLAALAFVMIQIRAPGQRYFWPVLLTGLAFLAMAQSGRLLLQPVIMSYLFLGITLWLLLAPRTAVMEGSQVSFLRSNRRWWLLPAVFLLWVNMDGWFLLGPAVVGLYLGGVALSNLTAQVRGQPLPMLWPEVRKLALVLGVAIVATLVSPHHIYAYTLPSEISPTVHEAVKGQAISWFFVGPWDADYFRDTPWHNPFKDPKGIYLLLRGAYHALAVIGMASLLAMGLIAAYSRRLVVRWELVLPCLLLFGLSCVSARCIPFFVIAMAPVTALVLYDLMHPYVSADTLFRFRFGVLGARVAVIAALLALAVFAWPGWLSSDKTDSGLYRYQVQWTVQPEASFEQAALQLHDWYTDGTVPSGSHGFVTSFDAANYLAWYCPEEKVFCDSRLSLYDAETLKDFLQLSAEFDGLGKADAEQNPARLAPIPATPDAMRQLLRKHDINHVIRYERKAFASSSDLVTKMWRMQSQQPQAIMAALELTRNQMPAAWKFFWKNRAEWPLLYFDGRTTICAWRDPSAGSGEERSPWWTKVAPKPRFAPDYRDQAFGKVAVQAPADGAVWPREAPTSLWDSYQRSSGQRPLQVDEANGLLRFIYSVQADFALRDQERIAEFATPCFAAGTVGFGFGMEPFSLYLLSRESEDTKEKDAVMAQMAHVLAYRGLNEGHTPTYLPYLAVRYARQAIKANPYDPAGYLALADAYLLLDADTVEGRFADGLQRKIRQTQRLAALQEAVLLDPDDWQTEMELAQEIQAFSIDTALNHYDRALEIIREQAAAKGADPEEFETLLSQTEKSIDRIRQDKDKKETEFIKRYSTNTPPYNAARIAAEDFHLYELALSILLKTDRQTGDDPNKMNDIARQVDYEVSLLLDLGLINDQDVLDTLAQHDENPWKKNPNFQYVHHAYRRAMAVGDYAQADQMLSIIGKRNAFKAATDNLVPFGQGVFLMHIRDTGKTRLVPWPGLYLQWKSWKKEGAAPGDENPDESNEIFSKLVDPSFALPLAVARMVLNHNVPEQPLVYELPRRCELLLLRTDIVVPTRNPQHPYQIELSPLKRIGGAFTVPADNEAQRGMNALEQGDMEGARARFEAVINSLYLPEDRARAVELNDPPMVDCLGRHTARYWLHELGPAK
jgi:hypothetical protein